MTQLERDLDREIRRCDMILGYRSTRAERVAWQRWVTSSCSRRVTSKRNDTPDIVRPVPTSATEAIRQSRHPILTVQMIAEYLHCHPHTIYRLLAKKKIPAFRIRSDCRFRKSVIEEWLKKATIAPIND